MRSWKLVVLGGLAFYVVMFLLSFVTGPLIHNGVLKDIYREHPPPWRPELNQNPPDIAAILPRWITTGIIGNWLIAFIYDWVRPTFSGPGWKQGLKWGVCLGLFAINWSLAYSGIFNMHDKIWLWLTAERCFLYLPAGAVLGWLGEKLAPLPGS